MASPYEKTVARTIPEETIAEIKARTDLASVVGRTVKLKRVGRNFVGLCPFHTEKSPSFNVKPDEGYYYCFGCKAAGDVVEFVVRTSGRGFLDVIGELAEQAGVELPRVELDPAEEARHKERKRVLRTLELAQVFFRTRLASDEGRAARAYLAEVRKIDDATLDRFGVGFGGARDDALLTFLKEQGLSGGDGVAAGVLARSRDEGKAPYDFFRHRITVPIRGGRGEVLSFQGRIFGDREVAPDGSKRPKYVNGPQTLVYDKSEALFGLFESQAGLKQTQAAWRGAAVLVEGPLDAVAVHRAGVPTAVAPCGTGLTFRHIEELRRRTERVVVCLDADPAGQEASARALLMLLSVGIDAGLVALPDKDPDALARDGRLEELKRLILDAPSALDALIARAQARATGSLRARVEALDMLLPFLAAPPRELVRSEAIRAVAQAFNEQPAVIAAEVEHRGRRALQERLRLPREGSSRLAAGAVSSVTAAGSRRGARPLASRPGASPPPRDGVAVDDSGSNDIGSNDSRWDDRDDGGRDEDEGRPLANAAAGARRGRDIRGGAPPAVPARLRRPTRPLTEPEVMLVEALFIHPHLAARCGVLVPALRNVELQRFIERLIELLVRYHDEDPRAVLNRVPVRRGGHLRQVLLKVTQGGGFVRPDAYLPEVAAVRIVEDAILKLDRQVLEVRIGELQALLADADARGDHGNRQRLLQEQAALIDAVKALAVGTAPAGRRPALPARHAGGVPVAPAPLELASSGSPMRTESTSRGEAGDIVGPPSSPVAGPADDPPWSGDPEDDPWAV